MVRWIEAAGFCSGGWLIYSGFALYRCLVGRRTGEGLGFWEIFGLLVNGICEFFGDKV
jgi:hypothetical protein